AEVTWNRPVSSQRPFSKSQILVVDVHPTRLAGGLALGRRHPRRRALDPVVDAAGTRYEILTRVQRRVPVELVRPDPYRGSGLGPGLRQPLLNAEPGQTVGQVPYGLVVVEVGLAYPALRATGHDVDVALPGGFPGDFPVDPEPGVVDGGRPDDDPGTLRRRGPAVLVHELGQRVRQLAQPLPGGRADLEHPQATS